MESKESTNCESCSVRFPTPDALEKHRQVAHWNTVSDDPSFASSDERGTPQTGEGDRTSLDADGLGVIEEPANPGGMDDLGTPPEGRIGEGDAPGAAREPNRMDWIPSGSRHRRATTDDPTLGLFRGQRNAVPPLSLAFLPAAGEE
jgi:hypothetical protein